jgi:hypothetical protein
MASGNTFSVFALLDLSKADATNTNYFLSMAVTPSVEEPGADYGSFTVNGLPINVTGGMSRGTPPLDAAVLEASGLDKKDLAGHDGIYPTYFKEIGFQFNSSNTSGLYNTETQTGIGPQAGTGLLYQRFDIDVTNLDPSHQIHFDLYNEVAVKKGAGDITSADFAPFSHDAQSIPTTSVPEPSSVSMMLLGFSMLGGFAFFRRKK